MRATTSIPLHVSVVNRSFRCGNCHYVWEDIIKLDLQEVGSAGMDWVKLAEDRNMWRALKTAVLNVRVPYNSGNFLTSCKTC
jgi:hypothetical protein